MKASEGNKVTKAGLEEEANLLNKILQIPNSVQCFMTSLNRAELTQESIQGGDRLEEPTTRRTASALQRKIFQPYVSVVPRKTEHALEAPPEFLSHVMPAVWVYEGEAYDLTDFIKKHPGGGLFIGRVRNRDITVLVNIMHRDPEKAKQRLKKYSLGRKAIPDDVHPFCGGAPSFIFEAGFDSWRDVPKFDFQASGRLLDNIRERLKAPQIAAKIGWMDVLFDIVTVVLAITYILTEVLRLSDVDFVPIYIFVPLMVLLRISLSGAGHYLLHRPQKSFNLLFSHIFDVNYVPLAFLIVDGHTLLHHPWSQSKADPKLTLFSGVMDLPRFYRIPLYTFHKFGNLLTGMTLRFLQACVFGYQYGVRSIYGDRRRALPHYIGSICVRVLLCGEFFVFALKGDLVAWLAQFALTLWLSTFLIMASHDFDQETDGATPGDRADWAIFQVKNAYDLTVIGNKYVDCFLSAGLSSHRVHHVLPYQRSGFANIASEEIVREEAEKLGVPWLPPHNFFLDRLPVLIRSYLLSPSRQAKEQDLGFLQEHFHPQAIRTSAKYVLKGFEGIGSL